MAGVTDPISVAVRFNDRINTGDLIGLAALMTDDHTFVDTQGAVVTGKTACVEAWRGFFAAFPDYRNTFTSFGVRDGKVTIVGRSSCSVPVLDGPAIWTATVRHGRVAQWRVYEDTPDVRQRLGVAPEHPAHQP